MRRDDLYITVPSSFRCPISLDVMKSPVSLCTGVTYDRSSIQRWLDSGNNTCPATMQVLHSKDLVPNLTLQRLIHIWSESLRHRPAGAQDQARHLIAQLHHDHCSRPMSKLLSFAEESEQNRRFLAGIDGFVPLLVQIMVGKENSTDVDVGETLLVLLELVLRECKDKQMVVNLAMEKRDAFKASVLFVLRNGCLASRTAAATLLEVLLTDAESKLYFSDDEELVSELFRLVSSEGDEEAVEAALSVLICLSKPRRIRARLVRLGAVKVLGKLLSESSSSAAVAGRILKLLKMVSWCSEGRAEMCKDEGCVPGIVRRMMKVSAEATEHAVEILWSLCYLFRDQAVEEAVLKSNGVTKILLLLQSNCSPAVRQMARDLLKTFRVESMFCISSYDTKTTHIMPF